jgi:hypothetical protein
MKDTARKMSRRQEATPQLAFAAMLDARAPLHDAIVSAGMGVLGAMLEEERVKLCGPRYAHHPGRSATDPLTPRAVEQMVLGVSTRKYVRSIEPAPAGLKSRGTIKSAVSGRFVASTRERLGEMLSRDLGKIALCGG